VLYIFCGVVGIIWANNTDLEVRFVFKMAKNAEPEVQAMMGMRKVEDVYLARCVESVKRPMIGKLGVLGQGINLAAPLTN
jgi:hypothetical protein